MTLSIRPARAADAQPMCDLLNPIIAEGATTAHRTPFDPEHMIAHYIAPARGASCVTAWDGDRLMGFQALEWPDPDWKDWGSVPADWGLIASFVAEGAQGRGIGQALFAATRAVARDAGMVAIDATIRADNQPGLAYYTKLGFVDYDRVTGVPLSDGTPVDRIRKVYRLTPDA
jgi:L-amino acid N-acyltransferase YncA